MSAVQGRVQKVLKVVSLTVGEDCLDHIAVVVHSSIYEPDAFDVEIGYLFRGKTLRPISLAEDRVLTVRELPAVETMATLAHLGRVRDSHQSYQRLADWLEHNQWQMAGTGREIMMQLPRSSPEDEAVVEIQLPVSKVSERLGA